MIKSVTNFHEDSQSQLPFKRNFEVVMLRKVGRDQFFNNRRQKRLSTSNNNDSYAVSAYSGISPILMSYNYEQADISQWIDKLKSIEEDEIIQCITTIRKIIDKNSFVRESLMKRSIIDHLHFLASSSNQAIQMEAVWIIVKLACQTDVLQRNPHLINSNFLSTICKLLSYNKSQFQQQLVAFVGITAFYSYLYRDFLLNEGVAEQLIYILNGGECFYLSSLAWTLSNFCRGQRRPPGFKVAKIVRSLCRVLAQGLIGDQDTFVDCCWAISYYCDPKKQQASCVLETNLHQKLIELLKIDSRLMIVTPIAKIINCLLTGNHTIIERLLGDGVLEALKSILFNKSKQVRSETCYSLLQIVSSNIQWARVLRDHTQIMERLVDLFLNDQKCQISVKIAQIFSQMCKNVQLNFDLFLVEMGFLPTVRRLIDDDNKEVAITAIKTLEIPLRLSLDYQKLRGNRNEFAIKMLKCGLVDKLRMKQLYHDESVCNQATYMLNLFMEVVEQVPLQPDISTMLLPKEEYLIRCRLIEQIRDNI